jgi:hypothetical protein
MDDLKLFSVVVIGAMNPAIHHPLWYIGNDLLPEDTEFQNTVVLPDQAYFTSEPFSLQCQVQRWELKATPANQETQRKCSEIAKRAFTILAETPVNGFGINFQVELPYSQERHMEVMLPTFAPFMDEPTAGYSATGILSKAITDLDDQGVSFNGMVNLRLQYSTSRNCLVCSLNTDFHINPPAGKRRRYELGTFIHKGEWIAREQFAALLKKINTVYGKEQPCPSPR